MICNKVSYSSLKDVKHELHRMKHSKIIKKNKKDLGSKSRNYICPRCGYYHLTTMSVVEQRRYKKKLIERTRRLAIIKQIRLSKDLLMIITLQEYWMTLVLKGGYQWKLECKVYNKVYCVESL